MSVSTGPDQVSAGPAGLGVTVCVFITAVPITELFAWGEGDCGCNIFLFFLKDASRERVGDWSGPETVWAPLCVAERRATRPNGEWEYSTRRLCWATSAQGRCHPQEALYFPTFSHLLIVNKLLSLSLSLSLSPPAFRP